MSDRNDSINNTDSDDNAFYINENLINSVIRLRTSLEFYSINDTVSYNPIRRRNEFINSMVYITAFMNSTDDYENLENLEDVKVTISEDEFNKLDHITVENDCINECHVCLDGFKVGDIKVILKCKHYFHRDCVYKWLCYEKTNCPICRYDVRD